MRAQQAGFDFDVLHMAGFSSATPIDSDFEQAKRFREEQRRAREKAEREARERRDREARRETRYESPWDVLGVQPGAGKGEVRAAWVTLCKRHHPDQGGSAEEMKRVNRAWNTLKGQMR